MRKAKVFYDEKYAGIIKEDENGFSFTYNKEYLSNEDSRPVSLSLPLSKEAYINPTMIPFFDGLIPEGWLLNIAEKNWKIDARDRMGLLLEFCRDCIGVISIVPFEEETT